MDKFLKSFNNILFPLLFMGSTEVKLAGIVTFIWTFFFLRNRLNMGFFSFR